MQWREDNRRMLAGQRSGLFNSWRRTSWNKSTWSHASRLGRTGEQLWRPGIHLLSYPSKLIRRSETSRLFKGGLRRAQEWSQLRLWCWRKVSNILYRGWSGLARARFLQIGIPSQGTPVNKISVTSGSVSSQKGSWTHLKEIALS